MTADHTDEKKPANGGLAPVVLEDFNALIFRRYGDTVCVSTLGAVYSEPPRCSDAVGAAIDWVARQERSRMGVEMSLSRESEPEGIAHILAFMQAMESSYWWQYKPASVVEVPGLGRWTYQPFVTACHESPVNQPS